MTIRTIAFALAAALLAAPAAATVQASNPQSVAAVFKTVGYEAKIEKDPAGDPLIRVNMGGLPLLVLFSGCTKNVDCRLIQFNTGFDIPGKLPLTKVNEWMRTQRLGKVYIDDEGDPYVIFDVIVGSDGVSDKTFAETIMAYAYTLSRFKAFIG